MMNRKQRRAQQKLARKQQNNDKLASKMLQFDKLPDECSACVKPYDKKDKEMAMTWNVVVKEQEGIVRLYCPDCWKLANDAIETMKKEIENVRK